MAFLKNDVRQPPSAIQPPVKGPTIALIICISIIALTAVHAEGDGRWHTGQSRSARDLHNGQKECYRFDLVERFSTPNGKMIRPATLSWTTSGVWFNGEILMADMSRGPLARTKPGETVRSLRSLIYSVEKTAEIDKTEEALDVAWFIYPREDGFLIGKYDYEEVQGRYRTVSKILFVDANGRVENFLRPMGRMGFDASRGQEVASLGIYRMIPMNDGVFMIGDVRPYPAREGENLYWPLFAYLDNENYEPFSVELSGGESLLSLGNKYYSRDFMLMASAKDDSGSDVAYVLVMERQPWIGQVRQGDSEIKKFIDLSTEFSIPQYENREDFLNQSDAMRFYRNVYRLVESSALPIGLFSWMNRIFLLEKGMSDQNGNTDWYAREVYISEQTLASHAIKLPVSSPHIAIITSGSSRNEPFVIIEKGAISINRGKGLPDLLHRSTRSATIFDASLFNASILKPMQYRISCGTIPVLPN